MDKITVLYAEDDSMTVMEVQEKLEQEGFEVVVARDGNEALEKYAECHPQVIILDVEMPGRNGLEVLQLIRLNDNRTPIIIYSCFVEEEKQINGLKWGANVYLLKNYTPSLLVAQVKRCAAKDEETLRLGEKGSYDFTNSELFVDGLIWRLTPLESRVFTLLCKNSSTLVRRLDLLHAGWNSEDPACQLQLNKLIVRFRKLLKPLEPSVRIYTDRSNGYSLKIRN